MTLDQEGSCMKPYKTFLSVAILLACSTSAMATRGFHARDLETLDRYASPTLSPDAHTLVFAKRVVDYDANKGVSALWIESVPAHDTSHARQLTPKGWNVNSPVFSRDGKTVYFLSGKSGSSQLYSIPAAGGKPSAMTAFPVDVDAYRLSPDGKRVAFSAGVFPDCRSDLSCTRKKLDDDGKKKATGVLFDHLFVRHWDSWADGRINRLFTARLGGKKALASATLVGPDLIADVPSKPFGDMSDVAWAPDGNSLVVSARLSNGDEPHSTNFDLYQLNADGSGSAKNLTAANKAWDAGPVFSDDGKTLYYRAMKRPTFEADRFALMAMDLATGATREIDPAWDRSADDITLSADGRTLYTTAQNIGLHPLYAIDIATGAVRELIADGTVSSVSREGETFAFTRNTMKTGDQLYTAATNGGSLTAASPSASDMLPDVAFGAYEPFQFKGWNGDTVHGYVVKPWNYQAGKRYPVAFLIHGGPQGSFGDDWSYRWNPQTYAGQGYAVVMVDFHGSTGYGQAFTDAISQHWGDRPLEDLQKGWKAALSQYDFLNGDKACALGASYGGFMAYWIAGNWQQPWKCIVAHDGVFDNRMMGYETEELWFSEWENGGTPWTNPQGYEKFNPILHVKDWRVPMLIIHNELDYRIPVDQGIAAFTALQRRGIESKYLYFPDENHWVLKPQNSVLWHDTVNAWLKQHIGS
jgi:dipeptidyl aminopeptidase/acylaminoacyl peptidase